MSNGFPDKLNSRSGGGGAGVSGLTTADGGVALADNEIVRADGTTGIQGSSVTLSDVAASLVTEAVIAPTATTGASQVGRAYTIKASDAVASTDTAGAAAGGTVTIQAGAAARFTSGNANGGDVAIVGGAGIGTGTSGRLIVPAGTQAVPGITFSGATTTGTGIWSQFTDGSLNLAVNGLDAMRYDKFGVANSQWSLSFASSNTVSWNSDAGMGRSASGVIKITDGSTGIRGYLGGGTAVASATAMPLPTGRVFHVTGTTNITSITATNLASGVVITLIFDGVLTFTDGNNLKLAGDFVTTADDTITLAYDGTNFYEMARSVN